MFKNKMVGGAISLMFSLQKIKMWEQRCLRLVWHGNL